MTITKPEKDLKYIIKKVSECSIGVSPSSIIKIALPPKVTKAIKKTIKKKKPSH
jgi:hypothetical protein